MENLAWGTDSELTDEQFYNRERDIILIKSLLKTTENGSPPTIMLSGIRGVGKTVLLKKIKKELDDDYLIAYIDLSETLNYQLDKLTEIGIIQNFYQAWMKSSEDKKISTIFKKIEKQI
jgi:predicted AAA+ superfamily ATPase